MSKNSGGNGYTPGQYFLAFLFLCLLACCLVGIVMNGGAALSR